MDTVVSLGYGEDQVEIEIKNAASVETILPRPMEVIDDLKKTFLHGVTDGTIGCGPLKEIVAKEDDVTIVVSDITRSWMHQD